MLGPPTSSRGHPNSVDEFFTSLAQDRGEHAACVILSGTGSDGTVGLRAVKEHGGLTVAQAEAEYDGMMRSAVATGLVDFILRPEDIPTRLVTYFQDAQNTEIVPDENNIQPGTAVWLGRVTALLRNQTGHDFSSYKESTIIRRVRRRMHVLHVDKIGAFIERLRRDPREVTLLFQDLLIGVTGFFRDPEAFAALEREVVPHLFEGKGPNDSIRVWVPGCATGEEAYSIAILLRECAPVVGSPKLQIFASDIDEHALDIARVGRYPASIVKDLSPDRVGRFFHGEDGTYRVSGEIREICLFSPHNLLRDAPFSRLDLISCRNLLIYLRSELQDRVIPLFHYALSQNGYLLLGTSENVTRHTRLFLNVDKVHRIFRRRSFPERRIPEFPLTAPDTLRRPLPPPALTAGGGEARLRAAAERQLIERFAPAYAVVNVEGDVLHSSGRTGKYLELPSGVPDTNIFNLARPGLRAELRRALHKSVGSGQQVVHSKVTVGSDGGNQDIDLYVQPLRSMPAQEGMYMVVFQDLGAIRLDIGPTEVPASEAGDSSAHVLEEELRATKERLQTTTEELESSNEELKSGNEELQSMNEELQSANEELQTSKEELQSINEELQTVNAELNARVDELSRANNDMQNLLDSTQIATVFLDRSLNVKGFTPAAKDVFRLVESDAGRSITHVRARFEYESLADDAERVLRTLATVEKPVRNREDGTRYVMRMLPYRTSDNVINGVVMTFTDVTRISAAEAQIESLTHDLRARIAELETLLEIVPVGVMISDNAEPANVVINMHGARLVGQPDGKGLVPLTVPLRLFDGERELSLEDHPVRRAARLGQMEPAWQGRLETSAGHSAFVMISATPLFSEDHRVRGAIAAIIDVSEHKRSEEQQLLLMHEPAAPGEERPGDGGLAGGPHGAARPDSAGVPGGIPLTHQRHGPHARPARRRRLERRQPARADRRGPGTVRQHRQSERPAGGQRGPAGFECRRHDGHGAARTGDQRREIRSAVGARRHRGSGLVARKPRARSRRAARDLDRTKRPTGGPGGCGRVWHRLHHAQCRVRAAGQRKSGTAAARRVLHDFVPPLGKCREVFGIEEAADACRCCRRPARSFHSGGGGHGVGRRPCRRGVAGSRLPRRRPGTARGAGANVGPHCRAGRCPAGREPGRRALLPHCRRADGPRRAVRVPHRLWRAGAAAGLPPGAAPDQAIQSQRDARVGRTLLRAGVRLSRGGEGKQGHPLPLWEGDGGRRPHQ